MRIKRAVILTAIPSEYAAVRQRLTSCAEVVHPSGSVYEEGGFSDWAILIAEIGAGNESAAAEAERAIEFHKPHVVLFVGVAGGIKDVALGDVVCATKVYGYESGKDKVKFLPRPAVHSSEYPLVSRARAEARKPDWHERRESQPPEQIRQPVVFVAPIAAGSRVVASTRSATAKFLKEAYSDAVAVEMEGIGFLTATGMSTGCFAMVVRGISDLIDRKSASDEKGWQEIAADHASAFAFQMLSRIDSDILVHPIGTIQTDGSKEVSRIEDEVAAGDTLVTTPPTSGHRVGPTSATVKLNSLRIRSKSLYGREDEIRFLIEAWRSGTTRILALDAIGGAGKTELVLHFCERLKQNGWEGARKVYAWSFYSQGTSEDRQIGSDEFFSDAFNWFTHGSRKPPTTPYERGTQLAELVSQENTLFILDGMEPLQYAASLRGIRDNAISAFLNHICQLSGPGMCVVTTRIPLDELKSEAVTHHSLGRLPVEPAACLLRDLGVSSPSFPQDSHRFPTAQELARTFKDNIRRLPYEQGIRITKMLGIDLTRSEIASREELLAALPEDAVPSVDKLTGDSTRELDQSRISLEAHSAWEYIQAVETLEGNALALTLAAKFIAIHRNGDLKSLAELRPVHDFNERFVKWHNHRSVYRVMAMIEANLIREIICDDQGTSQASQQLMVLFFLGLWDRPADMTLWSVVFTKPAELPPRHDLDSSDQAIRQVADDWHHTKSDAIDKSELFGKVRQDLIRSLFQDGHQVERFELEEIASVLETQHLAQRHGSSSFHIDCHPLVREYFGIRLRDLDEEGTKLAHGRLFEYFRYHRLPDEFRNRAAFASLGFSVVYPLADGLVWDVKKNVLQHHIQKIAGMMERDIHMDQSFSGILMLFEGFDVNEIRDCAKWVEHPRFDEAVKKFCADTEEALNPLYQGVAHGCLAEREAEAYHLLYSPRIRQGERNVAASVLGLYGQDLAALACFFAEPFSLPSERLPDKIQALILGNAAFRLGALGRLRESIEPSRQAAERMVTLNDHRNAGINQRNLSERFLALGILTGGKEGDAAQSAIESITNIDCCDDDNQRYSLRANFARVLLMLGRLRDKQGSSLADRAECTIERGAETVFREAETIRIEATDGIGLEMAGLSGASYCEYLLDRGRFTEAKARAEFALFFGQLQDRYSLLDIAFDQLIVARANHLLQVDSSVVRTSLDEAVESMRAANEESYLPTTLLFAAEMFSEHQQLEQTERCLREVEAIASRGPMPLYQVDAMLLRCRMLVASCMNDSSSLSELPCDLFQMRKDIEFLIGRHSYYRRAPDLALLDLEIAQLINTNGDHFGRSQSESLSRLQQAADRAVESVRSEGWYGMLPRLSKLLPPNHSGMTELNNEKEAYDNERESHLSGCRERAEKLASTYLSTFENIPDSGLAEDIKNFALPGRELWMHEMKAEYGKAICDRIDLQFGKLPVPFLQKVHDQHRDKGVRLPRRTQEWPQNLKVWCIENFHSSERTRKERPLRGNRLRRKRK